MRSEAALLRVLLRIGADTLRQRALERGYERLAASHSEVDGAEVLRARRRHVDRTADL